MVRWGGGGSGRVGCKCEMPLPGGSERPEALPREVSDSTPTSVDLGQESVMYLLALTLNRKKDIVDAH